MTESNTVVSVASWEPRFWLGLEKHLPHCNANRMLMFYYGKYESRTNENRTKVKELCKECEIKIIEKEVSFDQPAQTWNTVQETLDKYVRKSSALVDISTMPRDFIWIVFSFLRRKGIKISYSYGRPEGYDDTWLSRDPIRPRLIFKHSGIAGFGKPTVLIVTTGFDVDRTEQLVNFYEPKITYLCIQEGTQYNNKGLNEEPHDQRFSEHNSIRRCRLDAYPSDHGMSVIEEVVSTHLEDSNVILTSLGPKPSAVAIYRIWMKYPQIALSYAPSNQVNPNYSFGLKDTITGDL